ncbi:MLV-related proviral Env polyprotein-like [Manis pentadactyla]|uniref:MLV-related proviral Env polyprotein-like n=1 Tax=Manis pentadactyla TaxID=143292 RepID=UPI00255C66F1|nr:MLV-related proviral Env polyprotein-like [Manis pentadactyla]
MRWKGPYVVILSTPPTVKVTGVLPWIHDMQVKKFLHNGEKQSYARERISCINHGAEGRKPLCTQRIMRIPTPTSRWQRQVVTAQQNPTGPLRVREIFQPPPGPPRRTQPPLLKPHFHSVPRPITKTTLLPEKLTTTPIAASGPVLQLVQDVYKFLNTSAVSNLTRDCWLCVDSRPLYYVGIAVNPP